jgi:DNA-binding response OmpR family regulator
MELNGDTAGKVPVRKGTSARRLRGFLRPPKLLLLSADPSLAELVSKVVSTPWKVIQQRDACASREQLAGPDVRLIVLDDEGVKESDRGWLLAQIRRYLPHAPLLYIATWHDDGIERCARSRGAHYYVSKPVPIMQFGRVLQSFLQAQK